MCFSLSLSLTLSLCLSFNHNNSIDNNNNFQALSRAIHFGLLMQITLLPSASFEFHMQIKKNLHVEAALECGIILILERLYFTKFMLKFFLLFNFLKC